MDELTGKNFGELTVLGVGERGPYGHKQWLCRCSCGTTKPYRKWLLVSANVRSCGCKQAAHYSETFKDKWDRGERRVAPSGWKLGAPSEAHRRKLSAAHKTHGMSGTRIYIIWCQMLSRCNCQNSTGYSRYGGRGIAVCEQWATFENFLRDMGKPPSRNHSIERIDNDGNYEPGNCRWATAREQANNRRSNRRVTFNGQTMTVAQVAALLNLPAKSLQQQIRRGRSIDSAIHLARRVGRTK